MNRWCWKHFTAALLLCLSLWFVKTVVANNLTAPCPGPCPTGTACKADVVYVYMVHDPEAKKPENAWMSLGALDLVQWTAQNKGWVTTRRAEAEAKRASLLGTRGQRVVIRKFFLMESTHGND